MTFKVCSLGFIVISLYRSETNSPNNSHVYFMVTLFQISSNKELRLLKRENAKVFIATTLLGGRLKVSTVSSYSPKKWCWWHPVFSFSFIMSLSTEICKRFASENQFHTFFFKSGQTVISYMTFHLALSPLMLVYGQIPARWTTFPSASALCSVVISK